MSGIVFSLAPPAKEHLVLSLSVAGENTKRFLYREYLQTFSKQREELAALMREELLFRHLSPGSSQADTTPFNQVHVSLKRASKMLENLGQKGGVFLKGKRLGYDPGGALPLRLEGTFVDEKVVVKGFLGSVPVVECEWVLLADTAWVVKGGVLQKVQGEVERSYWDLVYPLSAELTGRKRDLFLERIEEEAPANVSLGEPPEKATLTPYPVLRLRDVRGACADLWMDYGGGKEVAFHDPLALEWRSRLEEKGWERDLLEAGYQSKIVGDAHYFCSPERLVESLRFLIEMGWKVKDKEGREVRLFSSSALECVNQGERIAVSGSLSFGGEWAQFAEVIRAYQKNESLLSLSEQGVGLLDRGLIEKRWGALCTQEVVGSEVRLKRSHFGILSQIAEVPKEICPRPAEFSPVLPGKGFRGELHPYQQLGLSYLKFLYEAGFHGLLADEMGLGKTVQVLALFSLIEKKRPHLVVMPTSLLFNWRKEFEVFLPFVAVYVHAGPARLSSVSELQSQGVILTSYALLRQDVELLSSLDLECVVLDEAQMIKNPSSQSARAACRLKGRFRIALSGTPIVNRMEDLWSLFYFLMPELLGKERGAPADPLLKQKVAPFILRRTKGEVAKDLPPKIEQTVYVEMDEAQGVLYTDVLEKGKRGLMKKIASDGAEAHRMEILEVILRLRQICCHPHLFDPSVEASSAKLDALLLDVEEMSAQGSKVLIYSQFTAMLKLIEKEIAARGISSVYLDGATKDREGVVETFRTDPQVSVFLCSLKAGGVGLNLQCADYVLLFDPWWNEAVEDQAIGRAHRLGRRGALVAKRYLTPFSVEEKMEEIKKTKTLASLGQMMSDQKLEQLTTQDLLKLLEQTPPR